MSFPARDTCNTLLILPGKRKGFMGHCHLPTHTRSAQINASAAQAFSTFALRTAANAWLNMCVRLWFTTTEPKMINVSICNLPHRVRVCVCVVLAGSSVRACWHLHQQWFISSLNNSTSARRRLVIIESTMPPVPTVRQQSAHRHRLVDLMF